MNATDTDDKGLLSKINGKAVFKYSMLPGIIPRIRGLGMHFGHFAYLIALILHSARLIPAHHPVLNAVNIGRFSVRQVLAIAANNLTFSMKNIDQIAIFSAVVIAMIMIVIQAIIIAAYAMLGTAQAAPAASSFFTTPDAYVPTDVVLIMLEQTFGANLDFFGTATQPLGSPVYDGLHALLAFYSMAMMVVAVIIVLYYILTVVGEAAQSGTPFGKRFNTLWAPIRLVVALGLLVPMASGLNSAQYLTLWVAKMGSGMGTKAWSIFVEEYTGARNIVAQPASASTVALVQRIFLNEVCAASYNQIQEGSSHSVKILQKLGRGSEAANFGAPADMLSMAAMHGESDVDLSWSKADAGDRATDYMCGHITVSLSEFDLYEEGQLVDESERSGTGFWNWVFGGHDITEKIGILNDRIKFSYLREIKAISDAVRPAAEAIARVKIDVNRKPEYGDETTLDFIPALLRSTAEIAHNRVNLEIITSFESLTNSEYARSGFADEMLKRGWGAAGLWYGNIGKINQKFLEVVSSAAPTLGTVYDASETPEMRGGLRWLFGFGVHGLSGSSVSQIEETINYTSDEFGESILSGVPQNSPLYQEALLASAHDEARGWVSAGLIRMIGGGAIYDLKNNPSLDPMAAIARSGHNMITGSIVAVGAGAAFGIAGKMASGKNDPRMKMAGEMAGSVSALMFTLAKIGLAAGIFLAYIIPLMPFIYFSFAVIAWILEIFEAVVAMPLWALAHLRIDGEGMPGDAATQGYHLLLMILLRPALIIVGLIGGYVIFGAAMYFFSTLFNSATTITQSDIVNGGMGVIAIFVYTIIFAFLTYNIAIMCFKMIDDVPKGILRWMGSGAQPFGDSRGDPISGSREMIVGAAAGATVLSSGLSNATSGIGKARERGKMRGMGIDPDNITTNVNVVGKSGGGGSGGKPRPKKRP